MLLLFADEIKYLSKTLQKQLIILAGQIEKSYISKIIAPVPAEGDGEYFESMDSKKSSERMCGLTMHLHT